MRDPNRGHSLTPNRVGLCFYIIYNNPQTSVGVCPVKLLRNSTPPATAIPVDNFLQGVT